eukprot:SAG31_NODE_30648_length_378_cov_0.734767_2_plen_47_part_01
MQRGRSKQGGALGSRYCSFLEYSRVLYGGRSKQDGVLGSSTEALAVR